MNRRALLLVLLAVILAFALYMVPTEEEVLPPVQPAVVKPVLSPNSVVKTTVEVIDGIMSKEEAKAIAEENCLKEGESLTEGYYNENTKTWWFDAELLEVKDGCNPACVVNEERGAEMNWRCTGLVPEEG